MSLMTGYLDRVIDVKKLPRTAERLSRFIAKKKLDFNVIAFRGMSGAIIAPLIAIKLKKELLLVRKEKSHGVAVEGWHGFGKYIIVDDFVDSGKTVRTIMRKIAHDTNLQPVAIFLYDSTDRSKKSINDVPIYRL